jgi:U6 snRNA-associated Sm-like protein LSm6
MDSSPPPEGASGSPSDFLKNIVGKKVKVRIASGIDYHGGCSHFWVLGRAISIYSVTTASLNARLASAAETAGAQSLPAPPVFSYPTLHQLRDPLTAS